jgi:hypothetical protein
MPARKPSTAIVRARVEPPGYLCAYNEEGDALNLVHALDRYGIKAEVRENWRGPYESERHASMSYPAYISSYSIWVCNGAERDRAHGFKQGLLASLTMKGDASAFADGLLTGACMRNPGKKPPMIAKGLGRFQLTSGS